jgi:apolipoprotein N-acyltransferase
MSIKSEDNIDSRLPALTAVFVWLFKTLGSVIFWILCKTLYAVVFLAVYIPLAVIKYSIVLFFSMFVVFALNK